MKPNTAQSVERDATVSVALSGAGASFLVLSFVVSWFTIGRDLPIALTRILGSLTLLAPVLAVAGVVFGHRARRRFGTPSSAKRQLRSVSLIIGYATIGLFLLALIGLALILLSPPPK